MNFFEYFWNIRSQVFDLFIRHIQLALISVSIAVLIGVPVGILISRIKALNRPIIGTVNVIQAVPSLALLGFLIPFLGIGTPPAIFAVVVYSLLPIIKNTYTGLNNINPETLEAAHGIGMTKMQVLTKVQIPLALPIIMAGIRISSVTAVGLVTIAAFIGAGGLGYLVFSGIQTSNTFLILSGAIPACILALLMDFVVGKLERVVTPISLTKLDVNMTKEKVAQLKRKRRATLSVIAAILVVVILAVGLSGISFGDRTIRIGSKNFTEQLILGNLYADLIEDQTDIQVERKLNLGSSSICFEALQNKDIDLYIEYTGTAYGSLLQQPFTTDTQVIYDTVRGKMRSDHHIEVLDQIGFNNAYVLAVRQDTAERFDLKNISDIAKVSNQLIFSPTIEFNNREDGVIAMNKIYGTRFKDVVPIDGGLRYTAVAEKKSDVITAFSTDGMLKTYDLVVLDDDQRAFLSYYAIPMFHGNTLVQYPELKNVVSQLNGVLTDDVMRSLNYRVDEEGVSPEQAARDFLTEQGLIGR